MSAFGGKADIDWTCDHDLYWQQSVIAGIAACMSFIGEKRTWRRQKRRID
jgi:hypothetical protein